MANYTKRHSGEKFGHWTLIERTDVDHWLCQCDCGTRKVVRTDTLTRGISESCGCARKEKITEKPRVDYTGKRFNSWVVIGYVGRGKWRFVCDCGTEAIRELHPIKNGISHSCGCQKSARCSKTNYRHGHYGTRLYNVWHGMKYRCNNEKCGAYKYYGGRGIKVCDEWKDFPSFYDWAMGNGYKEGLSIDRIDVNGDYCPDNCRWATPKEQANNKQDTIRYEYGGEMLTVAQIAKKYDIPDASIRYRLHKGISIDDAIADVSRLKEAGEIGGKRICGGT